jgi:hypothetical protein
MSTATLKLQEDFANPGVPNDWDTISLVPFPWLKAILPAVEKIESLPENWDTYGSPPPSPKLTSEILRFLKDSEMDFPTPAVVPGSGGSVQLEWYIEDRELEIEFPPTGPLEFLKTNLNTNQQEGGEFSRQDVWTLRSLLGWIS